MSVGGPSRRAGGAQRNVPIANDARTPERGNSTDTSTTLVLTNEGAPALAPATLEKRKRMPWNHWNSMADTDDEEESPEPPAKRTCRHLENGDEVIEATITLPGGYHDIEVEQLVEEPKPELRRKRDDLDFEEDDQDPETLRRIAEGRLVRRRVGEVAKAIAADPEMLVVERFVELAAKYARHDALGESTSDRVNINSTEEAHISDVGADALEQEDSSSATLDNNEEDSGNFSADKEDDSDSGSGEDTSPRMSAQAKGKMPAKGPRAQITQLSNPITDVKPHEDDSANSANASDSRSFSAPANGKIPGEGSREKTSAEDDLTIQVKAKIINAVASAAEKRLRLPALAPRVPFQLGEGEWTDANGTRWKVGPDGKKFQRVAVKEWRRKYNLVRCARNSYQHVQFSDLRSPIVARRLNGPSQVCDVCSMRPTPSAQLIMTINHRHRVLVDKWVGSRELKQLEKARLLGWQDDDHEPPRQITEEATEDVSNDTSPRPVEEEEVTYIVPAPSVTTPKEQVSKAWASTRADG